MAERLSLPIIRHLGEAAIASYVPGATFGPRVMRDWEFVWLIEGDAIYRWNAQEFPAPEGSVVLCRPGAEDFFTWDRERRTRHAYFHFDLHAVPADWPAVESWPIVRRPGEGDILRPGFRHLLSWSRSGSPGLLRLTVLQMLSAFICGEYDCTGVPRDALPAPVLRTLQHVRKTLDRDMAAPIPLADLAKAARTTPEHLCRLFRSAMGHSPAETVRLARLDRAMMLLARSNYSIGEIATLCGFGSQFHFSRRFRDAFGVSPREMRKRLEAGNTPPVLLVDNAWL